MIRFVSIFLGLLCVTNTGARFAQADDAAAAGLLEATANCGNPNNPILNGLFALRGNSFASVIKKDLPNSPLFEASEFTAEIVHDQSVINSGFKMPIRRLGQIVLTVGRMTSADRTGTQIVCELSVTPYP